VVKAVKIFLFFPDFVGRNVRFWLKKHRLHRLLTTKTRREKSLSGNQGIRKWISGEQENRVYSVKRISPFEAGKRGILWAGCLLEI